MLLSKIQSEKEITIQSEVLELHGHLCLCGDRATQVRCKTIENFVISNFSALCQHCCDYYNKKRPDINVWKDHYPKQGCWVNYDEYIKSDKWQDKKSEVLARDDTRCVCGNPAAAVHHKTYANLGDEPISDLVALCRDCHSVCHSGITPVILMQYAGSSYLTLPEWVEKVRPHLEKIGGIFPEKDLKTMVAKALIFLDHKGHARQISLDRSTGKWKVF